MTLRSGLTLCTFSSIVFLAFIFAATAFVTIEAVLGTYPLP